MSDQISQKRLTEVLAEADTIIHLSDSEDRAMTESEQKRVGELGAEARTITDAIAKDTKLRAEIMELSDAADTGQEPVGSPERVVVKGRRKSLGEQFTSDPGYQEWYKGIAPSGYVPDGLKVESPPVQFKDLLTGASDTSAGAFVETDYTGIYEALGRQELTLRGLISIRRTTSDLVEFVRQTAKITEATVVAEANVTDYAGATGEISGEKPEGAMTFEQVTAAVKAIAVWIPATRRALADAAQLEGIINEELQADLDEEWEDQIINGTGIGANFTGVLNTSGILTQTWNTDILVTARKAITTARTSGRVKPTAWLLNPEDWETIDLLTDDTGRYYFGGPTRMGVKSLWGLPVVESETVDQGSGVLGDWKKAVFWDRELASLRISDSHSDFFIRNMIAILAEMRGAFGLIRPSGFVEVDLESGS